MHKAVNNRLVTPHVLHDLTLEDYVERALVDFYGRGKSFEDAVTEITSDENAGDLLDKILAEFKEVKFSEESCGSMEDYQKYVDKQILDKFDGFDSKNKLYALIKGFLRDFSDENAWRNIEDNRENFIEKIKMILTNILQRKRDTAGLSGLRSFVEEFGTVDDKKRLKASGGYGLPDILEGILARRMREFDMVDCGSSDHFDVVRLVFKRTAKQGGIERIPTDVVIKFFKGVPHRKAVGAMSGLEEQHNHVQRSFPDYVADTFFRKAQNFLTAKRGSLPAYVVQEFVLGQNIKQASQDPYLAIKLKKVLNDFANLFEVAMRSNQQILKCAGLDDDGVLVRREVDLVKDTPRIIIVGTDDLLNLGKQDKDGQSMMMAQAYLRKLREAQKGKLVDVLNQ